LSFEGLENDACVRVLLIDDDQLIFEMVAAMLEGDECHEVEWANSWDAGRLAVSEARHDVYLVDYHLGDRDGMELIAELRASGCRAPIICMTSRKGSALERRALAAGADDYLVKGELNGALLARAVRYARERRRTLEALRDSVDRYQLAMQGSSDGLWDWQLAGGALHLSARWKDMLGYRDDELANDVEAWHALVHPDDLRRFQAAFQQHLAGESPHLEVQYRLLHRDGDYRWLLCRGLAQRDGNGVAVRVAGSQTDVTRRAVYDSLTGLANRTLLVDRIDRALAMNRRAPVPFAVLVLDLDRFKVINDSLGHMDGDELLVAFGDRIRGLIRPSDTPARLGGDEFGVLVEGARDETAAVKMAERISRALAAPFNLGTREVVSSASIGIALWRPGYQRAEEMLRDADTAMYRAKMSSRGSHAIFDREMHEQAVRRLHTEAVLRRAIANDAFEVAYQPIVDAASRALVGWEALVRCRDPETGELINNASLISIAEEIGLVTTIDRSVLRKALLQLRAWHDEHGSDAHISVNLSGRHLLEDDIVEAVGKALDDAGLPGDRLVLEVTESSVLQQTDKIASVFAQLRERGVRFAMDDFGTGFTAISTLRELRFDELKLDRSFIAQLDQRDEDARFVEALLVFASHLGLVVVAEGIETEAHLTRLRALGCKLVQGYHLARPMFVAAATNWLREQSDVAKRSKTG
jgi:diguanylate cyclase (GGDEF)-like protein/PAS domain S-box-containing protein